MSTKGERTRRRIVDASVQLFSLKGYYNTSFSDIQEATGLTKGGINCHFAGKEELWRAAYERSVELWQQVVFDGVRDIQDPLERIVRTLENDLRDYIGGGVFEGGCFFFNELVELSGQAEHLSHTILDGFRAFSRLLAGWFKEARAAGLLRPDVDCDEAADFLLTVVNGAAGLYSARHSREHLEGTINQIRAFVDSLSSSASSATSPEGSAP